MTTNNLLELQEAEWALQQHHGENLYMDDSYKDTALYARTERGLKAIRIHFNSIKDKADVR